MRTLNLGILAHVDAGKTSLTERVLFDTGAIRSLGSVDSGNTHTDNLELERQRGITIAAAVVSFRIGDLTVNLIDTPGHPDFIAEVERVVTLLGSAIVVVSSVEGVQPQTRVLVRALKRLRIPFIFFVNKLDRLGADYLRIADQIARELEVLTLPMSDVFSPGSKAVEVRPRDFTCDPYLSEACSLLALSDESLLVDYLTSPETITTNRILQVIAEQVSRSDIHPIFGGVAMSGIGVEALIEAISTILPSASPNIEGPIEGTVFKIERGWGGEKLCYINLTSGTLVARESIELPAGPAKLNSIEVFVEGRTEKVSSVSAGSIARVTGLNLAKIGDQLGTSSDKSNTLHFASPTLETRIKPTYSSDSALLWRALTDLSERDPLINLRSNEDNTEVYLSLYGEVQKEVIRDILLREFELRVDFDESTVILTERLIGAGSATEEIFADGNPFIATVGLRVEPCAEGVGNAFSMEVDVGQMPASFYKAVEDACFETLKAGLHGWPIIDCQVILTQIDQHSPVSAAADFRKLTPLVLAAAIRKAGTIICAPFDRFYLQMPVASFPAIQSLLAKAGATTTDLEIRGEEAYLEGVVASSEIQRIKKHLAGASSGLAVIDHRFDRYGPLSKSSHSRVIRGPSPFDRKEYIRALR